MATDATGTPTSPDNIPTYNVNVDDPTGNGFNAAMAAIQTALSARASKPAGIVSGEVPVWNGTTWVRSSTVHINNAGQPLPLITTSTLAGGPPGSPTDGDFWIATAVDANGTRWQFQYNAGSASSLKWEFIGGPPISTSDGGVEATTTSASFVEVDTLCRITVARAGDYVVRGTGRLKTSTTSNTLAQAALGTTAVPGNSIIAEERIAIAAQSSAGYAGEIRMNGAAAATTFCQGIRNGSADGSTIAYAFRTMSVTPVRIS